MKRQLRFKLLFIIAVILVCLYGIIGIPRSKSELVANWQKNIRLGLDLRGGTYLVIQVQQQDAFNAEAGAVADRLKDATRKAQITAADVEVEDAKSMEDAKTVAVVVKGVPAVQAGTFRSIVGEQF